MILAILFLLQPLLNYGMLPVKYYYISSQSEKKIESIQGIYNRVSQAYKEFLEACNNSSVNVKLVKSKYNKMRCLSVMYRGFEEEKTWGLHPDTIALCIHKGELPKPMSQKQAKQLSPDTN